MDTKYDTAYKRDHYKQIMLYLNLDKDQDLIDYLERQTSKNETIKNALREKMKGEVK